MIVKRSNFPEVLQSLRKADPICIDTETTGLRSFHGDRPFSIALATRGQTYYLNLQGYAEITCDEILLAEHLVMLKDLFSDPGRIWIGHNLKFDLHMLKTLGIEISGKLWCTKTMARVEYNEHPDYSLAGCAERIGLKKDAAVEKWIEEHHAWEWQTIPGKVQRKKKPHYDQVPFYLISEYAQQDARITYDLYLSQQASFDKIARSQEGHASIAKQRRVVENELALLRAVHRMEHRGVLVDLAYTTRAEAYEKDQTEKALAAFKQTTGREFSASPLLFKEIFADEKDLWGETEKGNPSFDLDTFKRLKNPAAKIVLDYRSHKSKRDFYLGFLYHAGRDGVLHATFNQDGTRTGRFSSSDPNLQNLTSEEGQEAEEFLVRRSFIPRPGHVFLCPDYNQMEYRLFLDYAGEMELIEKVLGGLDVHEATAQLMGVSRSAAKTINFMLLFGGGAAKLAAALGVSLGEARALKQKYLRAFPGIERLMGDTAQAVRARGYIRNWAGRRCYYPNLEYDYTALNCLIQGGCAEVLKLGLVEIDKQLASRHSKLVLTIHDENIIEAREDEAPQVAHQVQQIMEAVYPHKHIPLTVGMEWSAKSLADKVKGFP